MKHNAKQPKKVSANQYYQDANGRYRDARGRFVSKSIAQK